MITYTVKVWGDGHKEWHVGCDLHRIDGPAVEWADGTKSWWFNGKLHREDGPAYEGADGSKEWWLNGKRVTEKEVLALKAPCNGREVVIDGVTYTLQKRG